MVDLLDKLYEETIEIIVVNEILLEYEEKIDLFFVALKTKIFSIRSYYILMLVTIAAANRKYVDCSFSANAHYLVSDDKYLKAAKNTNFPTISVINEEEFKLLLLNLL